jgi:hypothetical protein
MLGRRRGVLVVGPLVVAFVLSACGASKYHFINNSTEGAFFKVPNSWKVIPLTEQDTQGRATKLPSATERIWHVAFDASEQPDAAHLDLDRPTDLVGDVQIYALSSSDNDQLSQSGLRQIIFGGIDPVLQDPGTPAAWEVVSYTPIDSSNGIVGSRTVINVPSTTEPNAWVTIDGSELLDPALGRAYLLLMRCESQCYLNARKSVDEIATSWKVKR